GFIGSNGYSLFRTGDMVTANGISSTIKTLSVLLPSVDSPGNGRTQGDAKIVGKVTLADKRTAIISVGDAGGAATGLLATNQDASGAVGVTNATWKTFGEPAIDG